MASKINHWLIGIIVLLCIGIAVISTQKQECPLCEETQDMTEEEVISYLSPLNDVEEVLASCNLTSDSLTGENVEIEYFPEMDFWRVEIPVATYPWGVTAKQVVITIDDDSRVVNVKCETYKQ